MPRLFATPTQRMPRWLPAATGAMLTLALLLPAREARAWSTPTPFYTGAARDVFSIGGDPAGNAFAVIAGESLDKPLLLIERWAAAKEENDEFVWRGAKPLPGGNRYFTNAFNTFDSFVTAGAGDGMGLIVWREVDRSGFATLNASVREPPLSFTAPLAIASAPEISARADASPAINASGDVIVALRFGRGKRLGNTGYVRRRSPGNFGLVRNLSSTTTGRPTAAIGGDGTSIVAWVRRSRVEARRVDAAGKALKTERFGSGQAASGVTTAINQKGAAVIAWRDGKGVIRASRRSAPGPLRASRAVRAIAKNRRVDGLISGVDSKGRTWVAWREMTNTARRVRVATAPAGVKTKFTVTQLSSGKTLGVPSMAVRPGGGAVLSWRTSAGWSARTATAKAVFAAGVAVSRRLAGTDLAVPKAATLAGPGSRVDLIWPQIGDPPDAAGALIYSSFQDEDTAPGA